MSRHRKPSDALMPLVRAVRTHPRWVDAADTVIGALRPGGGVPPMREEDTTRSPFFIVGAGRSGSTLLRRLLMERYHVVIPPEMPHVGPLIRAWRRRRPRDWPTAVAWFAAAFRRRADVDVLRHDHAGEPWTYNLWRVLALDEAGWRRTLLDLPAAQRSLRGLLRATYLAADGIDPARDTAWGDKTPYATFHHSRLLRVFPEARFVHLLRDGRDYVASYVEAQRTHEREFGLRQVALRWKDAVRMCRDIEDRVGSRLRTVRYERLAADPDPVVRDIGAFLDLPERDTPTVVTAERLGDGRLAHHRRIGERVSDASVGRYAERLSADQIARVERLLADDLAAFGYIGDSGGTNGGERGGNAGAGA